MMTEPNAEPPAEPTAQSTAEPTAEPTTQATAQPTAEPTDPPRTGRFLGVPYDWRKPTVARTKQRWWNPDEPRLFTPKVYGWGYDVNLARLLRRKPTS